MVVSSSESYATIQNQGRQSSSVGRGDSDKRPFPGQQFPEDNSLLHSAHEQLNEVQAIVDVDECEFMEPLELEERAKRFCTNQPSFWWIISVMAILTIISSTTLSPRADVYFVLMCEGLKTNTVSTPKAHAAASLMASTSWKTFAVPSKECLQNPQAQAAVAVLNTTLTVLSGILVCLTVGWWGQFSDRHGRVITLVICSCGLLLNDAIFLLVVQFSHLLPGGYRFLVVGVMLGNFFGGFPTFIALVSSYVTDVSPLESRVRNLAIKSGSILSGLALGPSLGSYVVERTGDLLAIFYLAFIALLVLTSLILFVIPESLTKASMLKARSLEKEVAATRQQSADLNRLFTFARPIGILLPRKRSDGERWDYNLFLIAITIFIHSFTMGAHTFDTQFLQRSFGWNSTMTGYWFSLVFMAKAVCLVVIIPSTIKLFKSKSPQPTIQLQEEESLLAETERDEILSELEHTPITRSPPSPLPKGAHAVVFDYKLAFFSLTMDIITYFSKSLAQTPTQFTIASMMGGLASGFHPAVKSVAVSLYEQHYSNRGGTEVGRLFGAIGIVETLSGNVFGPSLFGFVFIKTVGVFPQAIYVVALGVIVLAPIFFLFIRLPSAEKLMYIWPARSNLLWSPSHRSERT